MTHPPFYQNVTILTGASRGIGRALALQLAEQGAWLALAARDLEQLEQTAQACRERGGKALAIQTDVAEREQCQALVRRSVAEYGRLDTLVNNAGVTQWAYFDQVQDLAPFERVMQVNYFGSLYCTEAALPHLKQTRGRIVVTCSLAGKAGVPTRSGYAASKHAVAGFFNSLRIELASSGVSVTIVYPDFVASDTRVQAFGADGQPLGKSPVQESKVMTAETCARLMLQAAARRQREQMQGRGRFLQYLLPFAPGLIDRMALRAIQTGR
jgi:NAD(P)-dependent dehydrogenase (short-subunit alcohol dehydrogenase family)